MKRPEQQLVAGKEYHTKTTWLHQMWATDVSYFRVAGWNYYYLVTVMDDYSRFIPAWKLQKDMSANSLIDVVQEAVDATAMTNEPVENRIKLISDNGAGYVCLLRRLQAVEQSLTNNAKVVVPSGTSLVNVIGELAGMSNSDAYSMPLC